MNIKRMFWVCGPLGILLVSAVLAEARSAATNAMEGASPQATVVQSGRCPNGGEWLPNYICVARDSSGSCTQWQYVGHSCQ